MWQPRSRRRSPASRPGSGSSGRWPDPSGRFGVERLVLLAEHVLLHLAHRVARQLGNHDDALRQLEPGELAVECREDGALVDIAALFGDDYRGYALAEIGMRHPDHRALDHARDQVDLGLDLLRVHVEAARDDQVLAAPNDVHVALLVDFAEVAGDEEPIRPLLG